MKFLLKIISLILVGTLTISTLPVSAFAVNPIETQNIEFGNGLKASIEESAESRIAIYYENNIPKQKAIFYKESGDIYYYDLSVQNDLSRNYSANNNISQPYTKKYNIEDFKVNNTYNVEETIIAKSSRATYTLLKSKIYDNVGQTYKRYLYGYKDEVQYEQNSWHFIAGIALAVVLAVLGAVIPNLSTISKRIIDGIGIVGGALVSNASFKEYIKELYWVYKFNQTSPTVMEFVCGGRFVYEKQRRVQINGDTGYWETFYTESNLSIENTRSDILTYPGYYL